MPQPASTSLGKWTPRYTREKPISAISTPAATVHQGRRSHAATSAHSTAVCCAWPLGMP